MVSRGNVHRIGAAGGGEGRGGVGSGGGRRGAITGSSRDPRIVGAVMCRIKSEAGSRERERKARGR